MSSYTALADALSRIEEQRGNALARGAEQRGQIWGNAIGGLGSLIAGIPEQRARLAEAQQRQQLGQLQLTQAQRQMAAEDAYNKAISSPGVIKDDGSIDLEQFRAHVAGTPAAAKFPEMVQHVTVMQEATAKLAKAKQDAAQAEADHVGAIASAADVYDDPQDKAGALLTAISSGVKDGSIPRERGIGIIQGVLGGDGQPDPQRVTSTIAAMKAASKQAAETDEKRAQAASAAAEQRIRAEQLPGVQAESAQKQQVAAGMVNGLTPEQQAQQQNTAADNARADKQLAVSQGQLALGQRREGREASQAKAQDAPLNLTPEGLDVAAMNYMKTGQLPPLGMGDKVTRKAIINRAAELGAGAQPRSSLDLASNRAGFAADEGSLKTLQKSRDAISAFENTALKNIDIFLATAGKVVDTGSPLANTPARALSGKVLGSPDQAAYEAARQVALNEVAKITSNPSLAGQLSDSARKEVESFNPNSATLKQSVAVMRVLKQDMANRAASYDQQLAEIKGRISGKPAATPTAQTPTAPSGGAPTYQDYLRSRGQK